MLQHTMINDVIIVGSGPAGATLAHELSSNGRRVLLLEAGQDVTPRSPLNDILRTARIRHLGGGATLVRGQAVGGTTLLYYATGNTPPLERFRALGIDLAADWKELQNRIPLAPLRDDLIGPMADALRDSALRRDYDWQKLPKLVDQSQVEAGELGAVMLHRWRAGELLDRESARTCQLVEGAKVDRILTDGGRVCGVEFRHHGASRQVFAPVVVLAAGGLGSPRLLQPLLKGGLDGRFFCDPVIVVSGEHADLDSPDEPPMVFGCELPEEGVLLADLKLPRALFIAGALLALQPARLFSHRRAMSIMVKAGDGLGGDLLAGVYKSFSAADRHKLSLGVERAREILAEAGARNVFASRINAAHPGGTLAIGRQVDSNLETAIGGLYACDGSVLPAPWGLPPATSLMCLALRLARHLLQN